MSFIHKLCFRKRSKFHRRILGFFIIFGLSGIFFQGNVGVEEVHATGSVQTNTTTLTTTTDQMSLIDIFDLILKVIYVLLWPLLVVAGWALDNTLVYGSFFNMDAPLWKFRNMMKNFANFGLGFLVLYSILKNLFPGKENKDTSPFSIIKKTLIAGVLIQASWFLMAALIDVSTIATYAVGGLPLSVIQNTDLGTKKILAVHSTLDLSKFNISTSQDNGDYFKVRYETQNKSGTTVLLSDCKTQSGYVIGRRDGDPKFRNVGVFSTVSGSTLNACVLMGSQVFLFNEFTNGDITTFGDNNASDADYQSYLEGNLNIASDYQPDWKGLEACGFIVRTDGQKSSGLGSCSGAITDFNTNCDSIGNWTVPCLTAPPDIDLNALGLSGGNNRFEHSTNAITLSSLIDKSKGFVGPLVTMYASMLNFAQMSDVQPNTLGAVSGEVLIKALFAIAIFFPLIALAVVLIVRIGYLWMIIAASPLIVLKETFFKGKGSDAIKQFDLTNIISLAFAPVITVFALSISLIFMTTMIKSYSPSTDGTTVSSAFSSNNDGLQQIQPTNGGDQAYRVANITDIEFKNLTRGGTLDRFSWLIVNFIAIGFVRVLLFAAINASKLTAGISKPIQTFGQNFFTTLPVVPLPGGKGERVGIGPAIKEAWEVPQAAMQAKVNEQQLTAAGRFGGTEEGGAEEGGTKEKTTTTPAPALTDEDIRKIVEQLQKSSAIPSTVVPAATTTQAFTNAADLARLNIAIQKIDNTTQAYKDALKNATETFKKNFEDQLTAGVYTDESSIQAILNPTTSNPIIKNYVDDIVKNTTSLIGKEATFTVTYGTDGKVKVTKTVTNATK